MDNCFACYSGLDPGFIYLFILKDEDFWPSQEWQTKKIF